MNWKSVYDECFLHLDGNIANSDQAYYILPFYQLLLDQPLETRNEQIILGNEIYDVLLFTNNHKPCGVSLTKLGVYDWINFGLCEGGQVVAGLMRLEPDDFPEIQAESSLRKLSIDSWKEVKLSATYEFCQDDLIELGELLLSFT